MEASVEESRSAVQLLRWHISLTALGLLLVVLGINAPIALGG